MSVNKILNSLDRSWDRDDILLKIKKGLGTDEIVNDFLSLIDISLEEDCPKGVFNASNGIGVSIKDIYDETARILELKEVKEAPIKEVGSDDVREVVLDPSHTKTILGWEAKESLNQSLKNL